MSKSKPIPIPGRSGKRLKRDDSPTITSPPIYTWVDDNSVNRCMSCQTSFSFFCRRHHCRLCGRIFCSSCTPHMEVIPEQMQKLIPTSPPKYSSYVMTAIGSSGNKSMKRRRICKGCFETIQNHRASEVLAEMLKIVMGCWFQIDDLVMARLACVCKKWNKVATLFRRKFHNLVRTRVTTDNNFPVYDHVVRANMCLIFNRYPQAIPCVMQAMSKHPRDGCPLLPSIDNRPLPIETALSILGVHDPRRPQFDKDDMSEESRYSPSFLRVRDVVIEKAQNEILNLSNSRARSMMTRLAYIGNEDTLRLFLLSRKPNIVFSLFWTIRVYRPEMTPFLEKTEAYKDIEKSLSVVHLIQDLVQTCDRDKRRAIEAAWQARFKDQKVRFPSLYSRYVVDILWEDISLVHSHSAPSVVPFLLANYKTNKIERVDILFKQESVLNDMVMMECMNVVHSSLDNDSMVVWYSVVPFSLTSGIVSMVPRSKTLHGITKKGMSLQNYLLEHNTQSTVDEVRTRFIQSCAVCCVQSMLFGLGDRHLENILLTEKGILFHVDYGYIFGREPSGQKIVRQGNCMKLTPSIVDIMGGQNSRYFQVFRQKTTKLCNLLRTRVNLFAEVCVPLTTSGRISSTIFHSHLYSTFRPGQGSRETEIQIKNIIEYNTRHRVLDTIMDKMHNACIKIF